MIRVTQDLVLYATKNKIEDREAFVKKTFKFDFHISALNKLDLLKINEESQEKKINKNLYLQSDTYINSKDKKVSKATTCVYNCMKKHVQAYEEYRNKK